MFPKTVSIRNENKYNMVWPSRFQPFWLMIIFHSDLAGRLF